MDDFANELFVVLGKLMAAANSFILEPFQNVGVIRTAAMRGCGLFGICGGGGDERAFVLVEQLVELARDGLASFIVVGGLQDFRGGHEIKFGSRLTTGCAKKELI